MVYIDNQALMSSLTSGRTNDPFKVPRLGLAIQVVSLINGIVCHVPGATKQLADMITKPFPIGSKRSPASGECSSSQREENRQE